jgi:glycosyltransferase involved in cell wall biosynthesis
VPYCYYPEAVGGTEVYVAALARKQRKRGYDAGIAAPGSVNEEYRYEGARVFRFAGRSEMTLSELYGDGDAESAGSFARILDGFRPDVLHLHARSQAVSVLLVRAAKSRGIPVVFTYHTPTVTCARGTMLRWGKEICSGKMRADRCASCMIHGKGLLRPVAAIAGRLPVVIGRAAGAAGLEGGIWTALRSAELMRIRHAAVQTMLEEVDHICAVCEWVQDVLITNGIPREKITLSRQGVPYPIETASQPDAGNSAGDPSVLRLAFLGRVDAVKGLDTAIAAVRKVRGAEVSLDVFAVAQGRDALAKLEYLQQLCAADQRIRFRQPVAAGEVVATLRRFDALLVPSEWLETGPLVVYEAFAAGIPVIGSDLGGIAELVDDGVNGMLLPPGSVEAWAWAISRLATEPGLLKKLKAGRKPLRTAEDTARDAAMVYAKVSGAKIALAQEMAV